MEDAHRTAKGCPHLFCRVGRRVGCFHACAAQRVSAHGMKRASSDAYRAGHQVPCKWVAHHGLHRMSIVGDVLPRLTAQIRSMTEVVECHRGTGRTRFIMKVNVISVDTL